MARFCHNCGAELNDVQDICLNCGVRVTKDNASNTVTNYSEKSKIVAGLLALFFGSFGVHNFYLGYTGKAIAQLLLTIFGYMLFVFVVGIFMVFASCIWAFVEAILIFAGGITKDANGNLLKE